MSDLKEMPVVTVEQINRFRDAAIAATEQSSKEIERLNALVAMQADYIKKSLPICGQCDKEAVGIHYYHDEEGEEWCCEECHKAKKNFFVYGGEVDEFVVYGLDIISNTQATADAFMREERAKGLEEAADELNSYFGYEDGGNSQANYLLEKSMQLRAAKE